MYHSNLPSDSKSGTIPEWLNKTRIGIKSDEGEQEEEVKQQVDRWKEKNKSVNGIFNKLQEIYYNPLDPGSFGGIDRLYQRDKQLEKV